MSWGIGLAVRLVIAVVLAVILGNGSVVAFNNVRADWFADMPEQNPGKTSGETGKVLPPRLVEADRAGRQRLPSSPWKYAFTGYFGITGIYLAVRGGSAAYEIAVLCVLFVVLEMAISDQLYEVVPDQFSICLAVMSVAFINSHDNWWEPLAGAGLGLGISYAVLILGRLLFRRESIGGADIKFFTCMGFIAGRAGIVIIYILTTLLFAVQCAVLIAARRITLQDRNAMMPAACAAVTVYFLFFWTLSDMIIRILL